MREVQLELLNQKETSKSKVGRQCFLLPVEFFKTDKTQYIFDADHVVFLDVNEIVYKIVSILNKTPKNIDQLLELLPEYPAADVRQALQEITEIQKQDYLKQHGFQRANPHTVQIIEEYLTHKLKGFYLNITSQCNLSCDYCIFGGAYANQAHLQNQQMTWEIAQKAIDFFLSRASEDETLRIDFFGGEPLIAFPLMKRIVGTLKERLKPRQQEMKIYISSNGTLMNEAIADFLIENQINLQISIDGEKETHDSKRKFKTTREGSFDTILNNMKYIFDRDAEYFKTKVKLKAVITYETLDADGTEFFQNPLIEILNNNKHFTMLDKTPHYDIAKDQDFFAKIHNIGEHLLKSRMRLQ